MSRKGGWVQNRNIISVKKPHYHWIWPKDEKNGSIWGRVKDLLANKVPEIHISISADKMDYMHNRQRQGKWSKWSYLGNNGPASSLPPPSWIENRILGGRDRKLKYDYRNREYQRPHWLSTTGATWKYPHKKFPDQVRDVEGYWWRYR